MLIHLHKQATTTPKVRAAIQASVEPASVLADRFGTTSCKVTEAGRADPLLSGLPERILGRSVERYGA